MSDAVKQMYEISAHIGKCEECRKKMEEANKILEQIGDHIHHPGGE